MSSLQELTDLVKSLSERLDAVEKQVQILDSEVNSIGEVVFEPTGELDS